MQQRDSKGRFMSNKFNNAITNTNLNNVKENDTMMNKKANERMDVLKANGVNVDNFFDLSLRVPIGADIHLTVNGKEIAFTQSNFGASKGFTVNTNDIAMYKGDLVNAKTGEILLMGMDNDDPIAQSIINDGYVKNNHLFRRYIGAQTMRMLSYVDKKDSRRTGWEACMKDCFAYGYMFDMLADELHTLAKLQKEDTEYFAERIKFFNGDVVVATLNDYLYRLKKYCKKQMRENHKKYRGEAYCKLARYGNVLVKDLNDKVYIQIQERINIVESVAKTERYDLLEREFKIFMDKFYNKLPYETPKCAVWKDAFKGSGSFYSLQNFIRFHHVVLKGCTDKYDSEQKLYQLLNDDYKNEVWRFHQLLVDTIKYNDFNLRRSIADGNKADGTTSTRALVYKR